MSRDFVTRDGGAGSTLPVPPSDAATRLRKIADRSEREADYEDDGYTAEELRLEAVFLRETADLIERLAANQRTGRIIHGDATSAATTLRVTCWACGKKIKPDKADRALCAGCAHGGYFGGS